VFGRTDDGDDNTVAEELPDDYFTPTIADLKARQQHLHARAASVNNAPLLTRAQREEQAKMKRDRWPNVRTPPSSPIFVILSRVHNIKLICCMAGWHWHWQIDHDQGTLSRPHTT